MRCKIGICTAVLGTALAASCSVPAWALDLKPKPFPLSILSVKTEIPVTASVEVKTEGDHLLATVHTEGSLKNIQTNALPIVRALPMPQDNCAQDGINPVVDDVEAASLSPSGADAVVSISGHVTVWACKRVAGQAIKTKVSPSVDVTIKAPVHLALFDAAHVGVALSGPVMVSGSGLEGAPLSLLASYFKGTIASKLQNALDASEARASFPSIPGLTVDLQSVTLADTNGDLMVRASGSATMTSDGFNLLLGRLQP